MPNDGDSMDLRIIIDGNNVDISYDKRREIQSILDCIINTINNKYEKRWKEFHIIGIKD